MPIYEYRCESCGHELEALQKLSDAPLTRCPECGADGLKKLVSAAGFRLKGGGWYETDFKKGGKKNLHESHGEKPKGGDKKEAGKSETKPADKGPKKGGGATAASG